MLKSAGYELPKTILVHDFISLNGQKISKSLGNIIRPSKLMKQFGTDAIRYYFLRFGPLRNDIDFTIEKFKEVYNADLANGLGNLVARVAKLCENSGFSFEAKTNLNLDKSVVAYLNRFEFNNALARLWTQISEADKKINENKIWEQKGKTLKTSLQSLIDIIQGIAYHLQFFLPETAEKILKQFQGPKIKSEAPLCPRLR